MCLYSYNTEIIRCIFYFDPGAAQRYFRIVILTKFVKIVAATVKKLFVFLFFITQSNVIYLFVLSTNTTSFFTLRHLFSCLKCLYIYLFIILCKWCKHLLPVRRKIMEIFRTSGVLHDICKIHICMYVVLRYVREHTSWNEDHAWLGWLYWFVACM